MKKLLCLFVLVFSIQNSFAQYTVNNVITNLAYPVTFEFAPDGRYYICLKGGDGSSAAANAKVNIYSNAGALLGTLWDFTDSTEVYFERGVLGIALDPDYATNNFVYVFYNHTLSGDDRIRVVRFTEVANVGTNPTLILDIDDPHSAGNHTGGNIHFRPTDPTHLYVSLGDRATQANSQMLTNPFGKMLRIGKDGSIPTDNPFYDDGNPATGNDDRIWTYGHRNAFDFTFSTINDSMYSSENGWNRWDEVNQIVRGGNYGWPTCEGFYVYNSTTTLCNNASFIDPMDDWAAPLPAVTGIIIYDHTLMPEFLGHMIVVDYDYGDLADFTLGGVALNTVVNRTTVPITLGSLDALTDINQGPDGCIYVIHGGYTNAGMIRRICPTGMDLNEEQKEVLFYIAPNPADNRVIITTENIQENSTIEVYDILGNKIAMQKLSGDRVELDCSSFARGTYFVTLSNKKGSYYTEKLILN